MIDFFIFVIEPFDDIIFLERQIYQVLVKDLDLVQLLR